MFGTMLSKRLNWQRLFSIAEVVCFVSAWAVGLLVAIESRPPETARDTIRSFAANSDGLGVQAKLTR
jgi:hypothetical protein